MLAVSSPVEMGATLAFEYIDQHGGVCHWEDIATALSLCSTSLGMDMVMKGRKALKNYIRAHTTPTGAVKVSGTARRLRFTTGRPAEIVLSSAGWKLLPGKRRSIASNIATGGHSQTLKASNHLCCRTASTKPGRLRNSQVTRALHRRRV